MHRRTRRVAFAGIVVAPVLAVAGCGSGADTTPKAASGAAPEPSAAPAVTYTVPAKACTGVDTSALDGILGAARNHYDKVADSPALASVTCSVSYASHVLNVQIGIAHEGSGEIMYLGLRKVQEKSGKVTAVPGLGSGAYRWTDPLTGPHVEAWDGNLSISVGLASLERGAAQRGADALPQVVAATLARMRP